jgi:magnesium transporter
MLQPGTNGDGGAATFCFLSELLGKKVYGKGHELFGKVQDVVATMNDKYPRVDGLVFEHEGERRFVPVGSKDLTELARRPAIELGETTTVKLDLTEKQFLVRQTLYDKQIVDVDGAKVERVNDVHLLVYSEKPFLIHVDVGFTGLTRRLGFERGVRSIARVFGRDLKDELISWKCVQPFPERPTSSLHVKLKQDQIKQLHPGELADILEELDRDERISFVNTIGAEEAADALEEADLAVQTSILRDLKPEVAADIIEEMEPAAAVDVMMELPEGIQKSIMDMMEADERAQIEFLSQAEEETAASLMTPEFLKCAQGATAAQALENARSNAEEVEFLSYTFCHDDEGKLVGIVSLRDLILAKPESPLTEVMHPRLATLTRGDELETVAETFFKYRFKAIPVVDAEGRVEGVVNFQHSFDELLPLYVKLLP